MTEPSDATSLNASERDLLAAVGLCVEKPGIPSVAEARSVAQTTSKRFENQSGAFYMALEGLEEEGYITYGGKHPEDARSKKLGLTLDGESALADLAERSAEAAAIDPTADNQA